jgi:hypothetical protein
MWSGMRECVDLYRQTIGLELIANTQAKLVLRLPEESNASTMSYPFLISRCVDPHTRTP